MGDIVMASGLPSSVKQHYNNKVTVSWLVETPYASLVADHPDVDNVICWPKQEWQRLASAKRYLALCRAILKFRLQLRQYRFDLVIDPQGLLKSALLGWLSGAPKRIGFNSKERSQWLLSHAFDKPQSNKISSEYAFLAAQFSHRPYRLALGITDTERNALDRKLHQVNIKSLSLKDLIQGMILKVFQIKQYMYLE